MVGIGHDGREALDLPEGEGESGSECTVTLKLCARGTVEVGRG